MILDAAFVTADPVVVRDLANGLELLEGELRRNGRDRLPETTARVLAELKALVANRRAALSEHNGMCGIPPEKLSATLTVMDVAKALGCTPRNARALLERRSLRGRKVDGRRWRVDPIDLEVFMDKREVS